MDSPPPSLIPGLPDDVALECLLRVPHFAFPSASSASKLWHGHLTSPSFHRLRVASSLSRPAVVLSQSLLAPSPSDTKPPAPSSSFSSSYRLVLLDPLANSWTPLPPLPGGQPLPLFCQLAAAGRILAVAGGWDPSTWAASRDVFLYDFLSGFWRRAPPMPGTPRSFFACAVDPAGEAVYIAGGHDEDKNALRSAARYDVAAGLWETLPDMAAERDECKGVFRRGRFEVLGGYSTEAQGRFGGSAEGFDPMSGAWDPVEEGRLGGGEVDTCPRTCGVARNGRVYRCAGTRVEVEEGGGWRTVAEVPEGARVGTWVAMVGDGVAVVGGARSHAAEHGVWVLEDGRWTEVAARTEFTGHVQAECSFEI